MNKKRFLSFFTAASIVLSGINVLAEEEGVAEQISNSRSGAEISHILDNDISGELGVDYSDYNKLANRQYIGTAIYNAPHSTAEEIKAAFDVAMTDAIKQVDISQFTIGAVLNTNGTQVGNDKDGLQFKAGIIRTGTTAGITGYVFFDAVENPDAIIDFKADIKGYNAATATNNRAIVISGYNMNGIPSVITNTSPTKQYPSNTAEYSAFVDYADSFTMLDDTITVKFENGSKLCENVDMSQLVPSLGEIEADSTPLAFKLSGATVNNSLDGMALHLTYDMTKVWDKQCITEPENGSTDVKNLNKVQFNWKNPIDTSSWKEENISVYVDCEPADFSLETESDTVTYVVFNIVTDEADYEIVLSGITGTEEIKDRVISFHTTRSNDVLPVAEITELSGNKGDIAEVGSILKADYSYTDDDNDAEDGTEFGWFVSDSENEGFELIQSSKELEVTEELLGRYVRFEVSPSNKYGTGERAVSESLLVQLSYEIQNALDRLNNADEKTIGDIIVSENEVLGVEIPPLANPVYLYLELIKKEYKTVAEFKSAFESAVGKYVTTVSETPSYGASFNDTGIAQNDGRIYSGLTFVTNPSNGKYKTSAYFGFSSENLSAIKSGKFTVKAQQTTGSRLSYITAFSIASMPYFGALDEKIPPTDEKFALWADYINTSFTELTTPLAVDNSGKAECIVEVPEQIVSALNGAGEGAVLIIKFSEPSIGCSNNNINGVTLNAELDITKLYEGGIETVPANFETGVNPVGFEYKITFADEINADEAEIQLINTVTGLAEDISFSADGNVLTVSPEADLDDETRYLLSVKGIKNGDGIKISDKVRYFTTDSIMSAFDIYADGALSVGEKTEVSFAGYNGSGVKVPSGNAELTADGSDAIEINGTEISAKKRGTAVVNGVYSNFDGTKVEKGFVAAVGKIICENSFEEDGDTALAYSGSKSLYVSGKKSVAGGIKGKIVLYYYDDLESSGKLYLDTEEITQKYYNGEFGRSIGWHQLYADCNGGAYIDGIKVSEKKFESISAENIRIDSFAEVDTEGEVCTVSSIGIRGANASLTKAYAGAKLTGTYTYSDADNDAEEGSVLQWYTVSGGNYVKISGANGETFDTALYSGKKIVFGVTPKNMYDEGEEKFSEAISVVSKSGSGGGGGGGGSSSGGGKSNHLTTQTSKPDLSVDYSAVADKEDVKKSIFADLELSHWAYKDIEALAGEGIISGRENNTFCPDDNITRAEFLKLLVFSLGISEGEYGGEFTDVSKDAWYAGVVKAALDNGFASGYEDGTFAPDKNITREEMTKLVCTAAKLDVPESFENSFADDELISGWAKPYVYSAAGAGIVNGMDSGAFEPKSNATRAQAAVIISRLKGVKEAGK